jgi:hypothetical protein
MAHIEQDHHDRAHPLLLGQNLQDRRGRRRRSHDGLDGAGAGARHHDHERGHDHLLARTSDQHHRHPRPRRLHGRGGAVPARPRRSGGRLLGRGRRGAAVRDGVAPGRPLPGAAPRLRQQDGPARGRFRGGARGHAQEAGRLSRRDHAAPRPRGGFEGMLDLVAMEELRFGGDGSISSAFPWRAERLDEARPRGSGS